jgi:hypothetical protein
MANRSRRAGVRRCSAEPRGARSPTQHVRAYDHSAVQRRCQLRRRDLGGAYDQGGASAGAYVGRHHLNDAVAVLFHASLHKGPCVQRQTRFAHRIDSRHMPRPRLPVRPAHHRSREAEGLREERKAKVSGRRQRQPSYFARKNSETARWQRATRPAKSVSTVVPVIRKSVLEPQSRLLPEEVASPGIQAPLARRGHDHGAHQTPGLDRQVLQVCDPSRPRTTGRDRLARPRGQSSWGRLLNIA